jgi:hypothetical protein
MANCSRSWKHSGTASRGHMRWPPAMADCPRFREQFATVPAPMSRAAG